MERTIVVLKPDCVARGLIGQIISRFENKGLKIVGLKMMKLRRKMIDTMYAHLADREFYPRLVKFMRRTPVVCIALEGYNAIEVVRRMCGVTIGREATAGTMRGDFSMSTRMNIIHAADSTEMAERELALFFKKRELLRYKLPVEPFVYCEEELGKEVKIPKPRKAPELEQ